MTYNKQFPLLPVWKQLILVKLKSSMSKAGVLQLLPLFARALPHVVVEELLRIACVPPKVPAGGP